MAKPPDLDANGKPLGNERPPDIEAQSNVSPVSSKEPTTWWGGFLKGVLGDKPMMTTAGITAAGLAAPVTGGSSLLTIPAIMAAGGAAGAGAANLVRRATDSREQAPIATDASEGAIEGAMSGLVGPAMRSLGRSAAYVGNNLGTWGRHIVAGGTGLGMHSLPAGVAAEVALNPEFAPRALQAVGEAAEIPTVRRTISELVDNARSLGAPSMESLEEAATVRGARLRRAQGIRQGREVPYRAGSGVSGPFAEDAAPELAVNRNAWPSNEAVYSDVGHELADVDMAQGALAKGWSPSTVRRVIFDSPAMQSLRKR